MHDFGIEMNPLYHVDYWAVGYFREMPSGGLKASDRHGGAMPEGGCSMFTYCLFCETTSCIYLTRIAEAILPCRAIQPKQVQHRLKKGVVDDIIRDFMPGYIFLYFEEDPFPGIMRMQSIPGAHHFMGAGENKYVLTGRDEQFALMLLEKNGMIGKMQVYEEGQILRLTKSDLDIFDIEILKVDRRKCRMKIQFNFADNPVTTWIEYDIKNKV